MASIVTLTTMFTDLVDSTALSTRLGPEAAEELRQAHYGLLRSSVADAGGQEVKSTGDGLMVVFTSMSAALACAVQIQQAVDLHNRRSNEALAVRIGVSHGEAEPADGDYYGPSVVEAARLCAAADGGQILTTELVQALIGTRGGHAFSSVGPLELKGLGEPLPAVEVGWAPATGEQIIGIPLPLRLDMVPLLGLVGREHELAVVRTALKAAHAHERRVILVGGEAGIGKTTLIGRLAADAHAGGAAVLYGRCDEELGIPYQPWSEALSDLVDHAPVELLSEHVSVHGGGIGRLVPQLHRVVREAPEPTGSDAEVDRYELFASVVGLLKALAHNAPVLVVLDDLHWADKQTLLLLRHVVAHTTTEPVLIAGTYRDAELTDGHPLSDALAALRREPGVERIALRGLQDSDTVALIETAAGYELDDAGVALAHALHRETDGNPFFTIEVVLHLVESGVLVHAADGRWSATTDLSDIGLPESVREVIGQRVSRLGDSTHTLLSHAAVIGRDFDLALLGSVSERSEDALLDLLEPAAAAGVIVEQAQGFAFTHTLIQHSLYEALGHARRRRMHLRVGEALEQLCGDEPGARIGELARHWAAATTPVDATKAIEYARRAGIRALDSLAPDDANNWFRQALELLDHQSNADQTLRCDLLIGLGTAQRLGSDPSHRDTLLQAAALARRLNDPHRLASAALANNPGRYSVTGALDAERLECLEAAIDLLPEGDDARRAELLSTLAVELAWSDDAERRRSLATEAVATARRAGDTATFVHVMARTFHADFIPETHKERLRGALHAVELTERLPDPSLRGVALDRAMWALLDDGDLAKFDKLLVEQRSMTDRLGEPVLRYDAALLNATRTMITGTIEQSQQALDELLEVGSQTGSPDAAIAWGTLSGELAVRRGELADFLPLVEDHQHQLPDLPAVHAALAELYSELGRLEEARTLLDGAVRRGLHALPRDRNWLLTVVLWANTCSDTSAAGPASELYDMLVPFVDLFVTPICGMAEGPVASHLGRLATCVGHYDRAQEHFESAQERCRLLGADYWLGRNMLGYARMLQARDAPGDVDRARELLVETSQIAEREGYEHLQRHASALLNTSSS